MATIGQVLTAPEVGYKRYDDSHPAIKYKGTFVDVAGSNYHAGTHKFTITPGDTVSVSFTGTKIRLITTTGLDRDSNVQVTIDGVVETFNNITEPGQFKVLVYEKIGLPDGLHEVEFKKVSNNSSYFVLDALDIDDTGRLLHLDEVTDTEDLVVGKRIRCHYQATANQVGVFSGLGKETSDFIPPASSASPNGDFYFIMVEDWNGEKRLIADRNIQHSISWDTLNNKGIAGGSGVEWDYNKDWDKLTNYFTFDEASGNVMDSKGTSVGTVAGATRVTGWNGQGNAMNFVSSSSVTFNTKPFPVGKKSVRFKVKFLAKSAYQMLMTTSRGGYDKGLQIIASNTGQIGVSINSGNSLGVSSTLLNVSSVKNVGDGLWHDVLFTWDGTTNPDAGKIYVDDMKIPDGVDTATNVETSVSSYNLMLGKGYAGDPFHLTGQLDQIEIYNDVIDPNKIVPILENNEFTTRLMTGGISASDKDNEWDKYIVDSTLGGNVTAGDNNVWNWKNYGRIWTSSTSGLSQNRVLRGTSSDSELISNHVVDVSTSAIAGRIFRPLLGIVTHAVILPPAPVDIPTHLYKIESGLLFTDDFNSLHPRWVMSATDKYSLSDRPSYLRLKNDDRLDTFILSEIPTELFAIEVMTDYNPTEVGQQGGILVWKDNANKMEFLESYDSTQPVQQNNWMAVKEGINWTFLSDEGQGYNFVDTALIDANRFGIILKKQSGANLADLDIDKVIATRGNKMAVLNVKIGQIIQLTDTLGNVIVEHVLIEGSSMMFSLPRLEIEGILNILEADRTLSNSISATFHGGDVYSIGTVMEVRIADAELSRISLTDLGAMNGGVLEVQMNVFNPTGDTVSDIELSISEYIDKFGWQWADVALDVSGVPGSYSDTIKIPSVDGGNQVNFWVKVARGISTGYNGIDDLQFNVHLKHA